MCCSGGGAAWRRSSGQVRPSPCHSPPGPPQEERHLLPGEFLSLSSTFAGVGWTGRGDGSGLREGWKEEVKELVGKGGRGDQAVLV